MFIQIFQVCEQFFFPEEIEMAHVEHVRATRYLKTSRTQLVRRTQRTKDYIKTGRKPLIR